MMLTAWRIVQAHRITSAFKGEGAQRYGGRWNHKGIPIVYVAGSLSLAALELLVHLESSQILSIYASIAIEFDDHLCLRLEPSHLPADWTDCPASDSTRNIGTAWFNSGDSVILAVPSVIVPVETNYLINPLHPDFKKIKIGGPEQFEYDLRLVK